MLKSVSLYLLLLISIRGIAQQHSYDYIVGQYCAKINLMDFSENTKLEILQINSDISKRVQENNKDTISYILQNIHAQNDTLTEVEALIIYSKQYLHDIIYHCDAYLKVNRHSIEDCPKETNSLQYITLQLNKYLNNHPDFTYQQVLDSANNKTIEYTLDIPEQIKKDYEDGFIYPPTLVNYLLHKSDTYMKAWLYKQSMKLFE